MHMRTKKWAKPELQACPYYDDWPENSIGHWAEKFAVRQPLRLELGCGKGVATALMTAANPEYNFIAIDIADNVLGDARRNIVKAYGDRPVENVRLVKFDISLISRIFAPEDAVERIYINFCNPWTQHSKHIKRRLTHPRQLMQYRDFMTEHGEIWFKTDDDVLFQDSLRYFELCGFEQVLVLPDLHAAGFEPNYISEHERMYMAQGIPIKLGIFRKLPMTEPFDAVHWKG